VDEWIAALERACTEPEATSLVFQPVVDLQRGHTAGYEALARFQGPPMARPDEWLDAARAHGYADRLEETLVTAALDHRASLPANCFLSVNVTPAAILAPALQAAFMAHRPLDGVVIELTEQVDIEDYEALNLALAPLRKAGAIVAVDDAGSGYASLRRIMRVRPDFVKVDREFVSGIDQDDAKSAVVETLGAFASRLDAWLVAEGVERQEELDELIRLGVPLAQGLALGRPSLEMRELDHGVGERVRERAATRRPPVGLGTLMEHPPAVRADACDRDVAAAFLADPDLEYVVLVDDRIRPDALVSRIGRARGEDPRTRLMIVSPAASAEEIARRAISRPPVERFLPLLCTDVQGRYIGVVRVERLVDALTGS
jgi:EAL domain-containing protein (putative c-di-GMP-specific phosphodiesterase class I)